MCSFLFSLKYFILHLDRSINVPYFREENEKKKQMVVKISFPDPISLRFNLMWQCFVSFNWRFGINDRRQSEFFLQI